MLDNAIVDIAIGLSLVYCIYSLFATIINEIIASAFSLRAQMLRHGIRRMLEDENETIFKKFFNWITGKETKVNPLGNKLLKDFFNHPLVKYMGSGIVYKYPSYLSPENFSKIVVDILKDYDTSKLMDKDIKAGIEEIKSKLDKELLTSITGKKEDLPIPLEIGKKPEFKSDTIKLIYSFMEDSNYELKKFRDALEKWFNDTMDRASGWYKRQTQVIVLSIGFFISLGFNINTFEIVGHLSKDKTAREQIVNIAQNYVKDRQVSELDSTTTQRLDSLASAAYDLYKTDVEPVNKVILAGWRSWDDFFNRIANSLLGCLVTALAISLGAPFWFDLLSKLIKIRGTGSKPSEDKKDDT